MNPIVLLLAAGAALLLVQRQSSARTTVTHGSVLLEAGVPYRITVRVDAGSTEPAVLAQARTVTRASIEASGGTDISMSTNLSTLTVTYRAVSATTQSHPVGVPMGKGVILSVTRLDGRPIATA